MFVWLPYGANSLGRSASELRAMFLSPVGIGVPIESESVGSTEFGCHWDTTECY